MLEDKRKTQEPVPGNLEQVLNALQIATLNKIEDFGWHLWFVRRPLFQPVLPVVTDAGHTMTAVLEDDGSINKEHGMMFRP